jgi:hypothetical protein
MGDSLTNTAQVYAMVGGPQPDVAASACRHRKAAGLDGAGGKRRLVHRQAASDGRFRSVSLKKTGIFLTLPHVL